MTRVEQVNSAREYAGGLFRENLDFHEVYLKVMIHFPKIPTNMLNKIVRMAEGDPHRCQ